MIAQFLYYFHYGLLLLFGVMVSGAFSGLSPTKETGIRLLCLTAVCGLLQILVFFLWGEYAVWKLYPLITHLPIVLALRFLFGRRVFNAAAATTSAYLCCQIARWFGILAYALTGSMLVELLVRILVLLVSLVVILRWFAEKIAGIYSQPYKSTWAFGITPVVYYLFDYLAAIYSSLWADNHQLAVEFLPFILCIGHLLFSTIYYREYEQKQKAQYNEQILRITAEQQKKEVELIRRSEEEIRCLRHDLRLFLNSLSAAVEQSDQESALKLITGFSQQAEASCVKRYCKNDMLNYVLSDYAAQFREQNIRFHPVIELSELTVDEILFATILANALDNARNAQKDLPADKRMISLLMKHNSGKTLLCVKNTYAQPPVFQDGVPVADQQDHGYGTVSIQYATKKLGGNYRFILDEEFFTLHVII